MQINEIRSEIAGSVWKIEVKVGDKVKEDDTLIILESMKMEIPVMSTEEGIVKEIKVGEGDIVNEGDVVVLLES